MPQDQEIPKYIVQEKSLVGNEIFEAGAIVPYDGLPAENLEPTCDLGRARRQEYLDSNAARVRAMTSQFTESAVGDPTKFMADFVKAQEASAAKQAEQIGTAVATAVVQAMAALFPNGVPVAAPAAPVIAPAADPATSTAKATKAALAADKQTGESLV